MPHGFVHFLKILVFGGKKESVTPLKATNSESLSYNG